MFKLNLFLGSFLIIVSGNCFAMDVTGPAVDCSTTTTLDGMCLEFSGLTLNSQRENCPGAPRKPNQAAGSSNTYAPRRLNLQNL